ncbi:hypothetical protein E6H27_04480 [Candidatus Bathyarchaeota archaeon]|nr:MAG: hypothetical protein E6H27_04480 [Candidatus Bathyarchaeota archaeon]TMI60123.1 MAG: hypothetical protein E6H14_01425 [Candidatus Bathyarchaeota archaeon]
MNISGQSMAHVSREVEGRKDILATRIFRRTKTFVANELWPILDITVKHHQEPAEKRKILSELELKLLETIETEGSIRTDQLRKKLRLGAKENNSRFHRSLSNLESYAMIVGVEDPHPEKHMHANIWQTWDTRTGEGIDRIDLSYREALAELLERTIDACVLAHEDQMRKWFRWSVDMEAAKGESLKNGGIIKAGPFIIAPRISRS